MIEQATRSPGERRFTARPARRRLTVVPPIVFVDPDDEDEDEGDDEETESD